MLHTLHRNEREHRALHLLEMNHGHFSRYFAHLGSHGTVHKLLATLVAKGWASVRTANRFGRFGRPAKEWRLTLAGYTERLRLDSRASAQGSVRSTTPDVLPMDTRRT